MVNRHPRRIIFVLLGTFDARRLEGLFLGLVYIVFLAPYQKSSLPSLRTFLEVPNQERSTFGREFTYPAAGRIYPNEPWS